MMTNCTDADFATRSHPEIRQRIKASWILVEPNLNKLIKKNFFLAIMYMNHVEHTRIGNRKRRMDPSASVDCSESPCCALTDGSPVLVRSTVIENGTLSMIAAFGKVPANPRWRRSSNFRGVVANNRRAFAPWPDGLMDRIQRARKMTRPFMIKLWSNRKERRRSRKVIRRKPSQI
jgi:hypothetical protein